MSEFPRRSSLYQRGEKALHVAHMCLYFTENSNSIFIRPDWRLIEKINIFETIGYLFISSLYKSLGMSFKLRAETWMNQKCRYQSIFIFVMFFYRICLPMISIEKFIRLVIVCVDMMSANCICCNIWLMIYFVLQQISSHEENISVLTWL